jgi:hypothetical protein
VREQSRTWQTPRATTRAQVLRVSSVVVTGVPSARGGRVCGGRVGPDRGGQGSGRPGRVDLGLDRQVDLESGALGQRGQLDPAAAGLHDPLGDGQAEARACALAVAVALTVARLAGLPRRAVVLAEDETHLDKAQAGNHASDQHYGPIDRVHVYPYCSSQDRVEAVHVYE